MGNLAALFKWIELGQQIVQAGLPALAAVKAALAANGIEADTAALEAVIEDAEKRKAEAEASAQS